MLIRNTLLTLGLVFILNGCGILVATTATVMAIDIARDRRTASVYIDDNLMEISIRRKVRKSDQIQYENVSVTVFNGVVLLTGEVPSQPNIATILDIAKNQEGTYQVINRLELAGKTNLTSRANDSWITARVKTAMTASRSLDSTRVKVVTERANVYLMGLVTPREAEVAVEITRSIAGVVRVVKVFEYIDY